PVLGYLLPPSQLLQGDGEDRPLISMKINEVFEVDVDDVVAGYHEHILVYVKVVRAVSQGVRASLVRVLGLIGELLDIGDPQPLEEPLSSLEVVVEGEGVLRPLAPQDEPPASLGC